MISPKHYSCAEEDNSSDVFSRIMYLLHFKSVKSIDLKKTFGIKYAKTKHIPGDDILNDPCMEYSSFTKAHHIIITRLVWEFSCRIVEIVCPVNAEALLNYVSGSLS